MTTNPFLNGNNSSSFNNPFISRSETNIITNSNPFLINTNNNNNNNSSISFGNNNTNNNPFLTNTNNNSSFFSYNSTNNFTNPFTQNNNQTNNNNPFIKIATSSSSFPFPSLNGNNTTNNNITTNTNNPFNSTINRGSQSPSFGFSKNNGGNTNPFLTNNNNNPFIKNNNNSSSSFNTNPFIQNNNTGNNSNNNSNPFNSLLNNNSNNNTNNNSNPFSILNTNNSSNLINNNNNNNSIFNINNNNINNSYNNSSFNPFNNDNGNSNNVISNNLTFNSTNNNNNTITFGFRPTSSINNSTNICSSNFQNSNFNSISNSTNTSINSTNNNSNIFNNNQNNNLSINQNFQIENSFNSNINYNNTTTSGTNSNDKESMPKSIPLSKILSLKYQSPEFLEEVLTKLNEEKDNIKVIKNSIGANDYTNFIIDSILSSSDSKNENRKYEEEDEFSQLLKSKKLEQQMEKERIKEEELYKKYLNDIYKKNEKEELNKITKSNSQKLIEKQNNINKLKLIEKRRNSQSSNNSETKNDNYNNSDNLNNFNINKNIVINNININNNRTQFNKTKNNLRFNKSQRNSINSLKSYEIIEEEINEDDNESINSNNNFNDKNFIYNININVYDIENKKIFNKELKLGENGNYILDLDKLYFQILEDLKVFKIECKYGLKYIINDFLLNQYIGKINLLEFEASGYIKTEESFEKNINMRVEIINENSISEQQALLNPQLYFKNPKHYLLYPDPKIIINSNLFKYNKGLEIIFKYMSIIFTDKETYDLTGINLGEICYDGDTEIYFDDNNYSKEYSSMKKLWNIRICLIYKGLGLLYKDQQNINKIIFNYLNKRYHAEMIDINNDNKDIYIITKFENLFLTLNESKILYEKFKESEICNFNDTQSYS